MLVAPSEKQTYTLLFVRNFMVACLRSIQIVQRGESRKVIYGSVSSFDTKCIRSTLNLAEYASRVLHIGEGRNTTSVLRTKSCYSLPLVSRYFISISDKHDATTTKARVSPIGVLPNQGRLLGSSSRERA